MKTVDVERSSVSVEWYEDGTVKGKEVSVGPHLCPGLLGPQPRGVTPTPGRVGRFSSVLILIFCIIKATKSVCEGTMGKWLERSPPGRSTSQGERGGAGSPPSPLGFACPRVPVFPALGAGCWLFMALT